MTNERALATVIEGLLRGQTEGGKGNAVVFLSNVSRNYYIQASLERGELDICFEAVSNEFLEDPDKLSADQEKTLLSLGWRRPIKHDSPNFYQDWTDVDSDEERRSAASMVIDTFTRVYGLSPDQDLKVTFILED